MLYSVIPAETIWDGYESYHPEYLEIDCCGERKLILERMSPTEGRLIRLISSRHEDFLRPEYQPGSLYIFRPSRD